VQLFDLDLPADLWAELVSDGIIAEGVPLPTATT
jgi:hypothetical protein